jgi:hypothetical protein
MATATHNDVSELACNMKNRAMTYDVLLFPLTFLKGVVSTLRQYW